MESILPKLLKTDFSSLWDFSYEGIKTLGPWQNLALFVISSILMIWRLGAMENKGIEGTVLGTLITPYCSGLSNLVFAFVLAKSGGRGALVLENCLVNNVTNLTLVIGLLSLLGRMNIYTGKKTRGKLQGGDKAERLNYYSLLLTLIAALFFTGVVWALSRDGNLNFSDGLVLVGLFLFWQVFHIIDILKNNVRHGKFLSWFLSVELVFIVACAYGIYISIDGLVGWVSSAGRGYVIFMRLGWISGWLMVLPNALTAIYYSWAERPDIAYSSQVGDGHICIPLCIGLFALFQDLQVPSFFELGITIIFASAMVHFLCLAVLGRIPRFIGFAFLGTYCFFVLKGLS